MSGTILSLGDVVVGSQGGGTLDLSGATFGPGATTLTSLANGGTLISGADLMVTGPAGLGTLVGVDGHGSLTALGGAGVGGTGLHGGFRFLNPAGQLTTWGGGPIFVDPGSVFENAGTMELWTDANMSGGGEFRNSGAFIKRGGNPARYL